MDGLFNAAENPEKPSLSKTEVKRRATILKDLDERAAATIKEKFSCSLNYREPCKGCKLLKNGLPPYKDVKLKGYTKMRLSEEEPIVLILSGAPYSSTMWANQAKYGEMLKDMIDPLRENGIMVCYDSVVRCPTLDRMDARFKDVDKEPPVGCIKACVNHVAEVLTRLQPDVIVCLGKAPACIFGIAGKVKSMYNRVYDVSPLAMFDKETCSFDTAKYTRPAKLIVTYTLDQVYEDYTCKDAMTSAFRQAGRLAQGFKAEPPDNYYLIESADEFKTWAKRHMSDVRLSKAVHAFDIETNGRDIHPKTPFSAAHPPKLRCISFSWNKGMAICVPYEDDPEGYYPILKEFMESDIPFVGHNVAFDIYFLKLVNDIHTKVLVGDTMLMAALLNPGRGKYGYGLKPLAAEYTDLGGYETDMKSTEDEKDAAGNIVKSKWEIADMSVMAPYNCADADSTLQIFKIFYEKISKAVTVVDSIGQVFLRKPTPYERQPRPPLTVMRMLDAHQVMTKALFPLADMEHNGFLIDREWTDNSRRIIQGLQERFSNELADLRPGELKGKRADWGSPDQISDILTREFGVDMKQIVKDPLVETLINSEKESVGDVVLAAIHNDFTHVLRKWRKASKLLSTYFDGYLVNNGLDGHLRADFNIVGTVTGRLSSSGDANLRIWRLFVVTQR